jgi:hypothetical protein
LTADVALAVGPECVTHRAMSNINWKLIAFWAVLWWLVYSAPTEDVLSNMLSDSLVTQQADTF